MGFDIRKILVIFAIAVLFSLFSYALFDAFYPQREFTDFCKDRPFVEFNNSASCEANGGKWNSIVEAQPVKGPSGASGYCDINYYCNQQFNEANKARNFWLFAVMSILGVIAIIVGLFLPTTNEINQWVGTGFMLGGLFNIFFGTANYYQDIGRYYKPVILLVELALVIFLIYKTVGKYSTKEEDNRVHIPIREKPEARRKIDAVKRPLKRR